MENEQPQQPAPFSAIFHKRSVSPKPLAIMSQDHQDLEDRRASLPLYLRLKLDYDEQQENDLLQQKKETLQKLRDFQKIDIGRLASAQDKDYLKVKEAR